MEQLFISKLKKQLKPATKDNKECHSIICLSVHATETSLGITPMLNLFTHHAIIQYLSLFILELECL